MAVHTPLQSSGAISLSDVQTEFGGSNPVSMNEYYRDASYTNHDGAGVPNLAVNSDIPNSGTVGMDDFHATVGSVTITISSNFTGSWNLRNTLIASPYSWDGSSPIAIYLVINSGVTLAASATSHYALDCELHTTSMLTIINNGSIIGKGGAGGGGGSPGGNGGSGGGGGTAIRLKDIGAGVVITNNNLIAGGGGGGGGNGGYRNHGSSEDQEGNCEGGINSSGGAGGKGRDGGDPAGNANGAAGTGGGNYATAGSSGAAGGASGCNPVNGSGGGGGGGGLAIQRVAVKASDGSGTGGPFTLNGTATHSYNNTNGIAGAT